MKSRRMRWAGHASHMGERRDLYRVLVGKPDRKRQLRRCMHRWEDNNKVDLQEVGWGDMDWIDLVLDRDRWRVLVIAVMNLRIPKNAANFLTS
jgi:hypothetical protein